MTSKTVMYRMKQALRNYYHLKDLLQQCKGADVNMVYVQIITSGC